MCKEAKAIIESERLSYKDPTIATHADEDPGRGKQEAVYSDQLRATISRHGDLFCKTSMKKRSGTIGMW